MNDELRERILRWYCGDDLPATVAVELVDELISEGSLIEASRTGHYQSDEANARASLRDVLASSGLHPKTGAET